MVKFAAECFAIAALGLAVTRPSAASAEQLVTFDSAGARVGQGELSGVRGYLSRPNGRGPFPAVVLLHSCLGLPVNRRVIGEAMARWGYVALFVDDFATRGLEQTCAVDFPEGVADAFGALRYLAKLPYVDPSRIGAVGYSQGADTALAISTSRYAAGLAPSEDPKFKAAAAFYPPCENQGGARLRIPTLDSRRRPRRGHARRRLRAAGERAADRSPRSEAGRLSRRRARIRQSGVCRRNAASRDEAGL